MRVPLVIEGMKMKGLEVAGDDAEARGKGLVRDNEAIIKGVVYKCVLVFLGVFVIGFTHIDSISHYFDLVFLYTKFHTFSNSNL